MMAFRVDISPGAKRDLSAAFAWYKEKSSKAANASFGRNERRCPAIQNVPGYAPPSSRTFCPVK